MCPRSHSKELAEVGFSGPCEVAGLCLGGLPPPPRHSVRSLEGALSAPTQPPPSGVQQGSKEGVGGWAGDPCPHKPSSAWPDAFGAWRQGLENGAAINSVRQHHEAVKPAQQRLECGGIQEGFSGRVWPDSIFGALGSKGSPPPFCPSPPSPGHPAALSSPPCLPPPLPYFCSCFHVSLLYLVPLSPFLSEGWYSPYMSPLAV